MVGTLIHLLVCRVTFGDDTLSDLLQNIQKRLGPNLENQYISIAEIQHSLSLGERKLFNSIISIIHAPPARAEDEQSAIEIKQHVNHTATEVR